MSQLWRVLLLVVENSWSTAFNKVDQQYVVILVYMRTPHAKKRLSCPYRRRMSGRVEAGPQVVWLAGACDAAPLPSVHQHIGNSGVGSSVFGYTNALVSASTTLITFNLQTHIARLNPPQVMSLAG
jgi:hypothetical protein